jgi:hypothetical protein
MTTLCLEGPTGHAIIRKNEDGKWTAKVFCRGELHTDLGVFKTRREATDTASYHLAYEVK